MKAPKEKPQPFGPSVVYPLKPYQPKSLTEEQKRVLRGIGKGELADRMFVAALINLITKELKEEEPE